MTRDPSTFSSLWNASATLDAALKTIGGTRSALSAYAHSLRTRGVALQDFRRGIRDFATRPSLSLPQLFYAAKETTSETGLAAESPGPGESV